MVVSNRSTGRRAKAKKPEKKTKRRRKNYNNNNDNVAGAVGGPQCSSPLIPKAFRSLRRVASGIKRLAGLVSRSSVDSKCDNTAITAAATAAATATATVSPGFRQGAARGTRSSRPELATAFEWGALEIKKQSKRVVVSTNAAADKDSTSEKSKNRKGRKRQRNKLEAAQEQVSLPSGGEDSAGAKEMSRNRPRGPPLARDNGLPASEETDMWNRILQDLRKAKEKNDKQRALGEQIAALNEKIAQEGNRPTPSEHSQLDLLYRQMLKLCDEERAILVDEPSDVIKNLGLLMALRQASEAEAPMSRAASLSKSRKKRNEVDGSVTDSPGPTPVPVSEKLNRVKGSSVHRSSSVSSAQTREAARDRSDHVAVKIEENADMARGLLAERTGQLVVGAEVVFKHNKNKHGVEGEGIQCIIKGVSGEGHKRRYDVQDPEPNENGEEGAVYKTTAASLIPIPRVGSALPSFAVGKQVLARYPDTTTFYRAEVMGSKKDVYRLKFEGEEDDKEMEVDKRFVLDLSGK